jgi:hypothetical protein
MDHIQRIGTGQRSPISGRFMANLELRHGLEKGSVAEGSAHPLAGCGAAASIADVKLRYELYRGGSFAASRAIEQKTAPVSSASDFRRLGRGFPVVLKN